MGIVIPFADFKRAYSSTRTPSSATIDLDDEAIARAMHAAADQSSVLQAAHPLLIRCRDRYGFIVMQDGLPRDPTTLARAILDLCRGLSMLEATKGAPRTYPIFGVYFGHRQFGWFEDGHSGTTALAVPNDFAAAEFAAFVQSRVVAGRSHFRL